MSGNFIESDLKEFLSASSAVNTLVPQAQIYGAYVRSDAVFPAISITTVGSTRTRTFENKLTIMRRIQVDAWSPTIPGVKNLETVLTNLLDNFTGQFVAGSFAVINCEATTIIDSWEVNSSVYRVMIQFEIEYS